MKLVKDSTKDINQKVTDKEAEESFIKILSWLGEDPGREGLIETPKRVIKAFKEYFKGYNEIKKVLEKTFGDVEGYDDMVIKKYFCSKSLRTPYGTNHWSGCVAYIPKDRVVGLVN